MTKLDKKWAIREIELFLEVTAQVHPRTAPGTVYLGTVMKGPLTEASERAYVVEQILDRTIPNWKQDRPSNDKDFRWLRKQASRAKVALEREEELAQKLGDNSPEMDTSNLHPWVWGNIQSLWQGGHYHQAVRDAAIQVNAETQKKLGRQDVSETNLFNQAFSLDAPKIGKPRLRLMDDDDSRTYQSIHRGARALAEGLYSGIRNPAMHTLHENTDDEEQIALEQLAAFSLLARWVDQATIIQV
ncbi:TIGR02391 family protein [Rothia sp. CCM 9417]|uniref:TIGR02391 family protein n=1 Tax=Rothia sp. CCM 9417 TaxID=3402657 RepID=UPI003AEEDAA2